MVLAGSLVRMFKFYRFQPRLAIVNQTLQKAAPDLFHFLLMFVTFIYGFSVITHILFGPQLIFFASISESMATTFTYMLTAAPNQAAVANVDGEMAVVWYLCFMIIVTIILLNVLLAILVDSYMAAKEEELEHWQELGYEELPRHVVEEIEDKGRGDGGVRVCCSCLPRLNHPPVPCEVLGIGQLLQQVIAPPACAYFPL